ncbi:hypothetical protein NXA99_07270 [Citrobacter amalonaticus]|jgi:hypothetical protein|uniref:hypothetical protein n=1 Tax=Citrobacter amalonaticus TaxID=35703 RepID=UPI00215D3422|nr:hypothetical protein [Citrobacter amalonaticus]MCR9028333.1 hypothetical protein [Citrobacter amalonaticus]
MKLNAEVRGGNKLEKKLRQYMDRLTSKRRVLVGIPEGAGKYEDGTPLAVIGVVQELGSADGLIPERSFLRVPLRQNKENISRAFRALTGKVARGEITLIQMLDQIGARAAGYCIEAIENGIAPPNADSTIKAKGSSTPLVDLGRMKGSITHVVED